MEAHKINSGGKIKFSDGWISRGGAGGGSARARVSENPAEFYGSPRRASLEESCGATREKKKNWLINLSDM